MRSAYFRKSKGAIVPTSHKGRGKEVRFPSDATAPSVILTEASERSPRGTTSGRFAKSVILTEGSDGDRSGRISDSFALAKPVPVPSRLHSILVSRPPSRFFALQRAEMADLNSAMPAKGVNIQPA
jgi:hypothetical protein